MKQYAVFGLGSFGYSVAVTLQSLGCEVIAVDSNMESVKDIADKVSYSMKADFAEPEVVRSLGARNLDGVVIAVAENMEASVMATLVAKEMGVPYVLAKAKNEIHANILKKIGADAVIFPEEEMGKKVAKNLMSANFADWIALSSEYSIVEIMIPQDWVGKSLTELNIRRTHGINVVGIKSGEEVEVNFDPHTPLPDGVVVILVGENKALERL